MRGLGFDGCTARERHTVCNKTDRILGLTKKSASADFLVDLVTSIPLFANGELDWIPAFAPPAQRS